MVNMTHCHVGPGDVFIFEVPLLVAAAVFARLCDAEDGEELVPMTSGVWPVIRGLIERST